MRSPVLYRAAQVSAVYYIFTQTANARLVIVLQMLCHVAAANETIVSGKLHWGACICTNGFANVILVCCVIVQYGCWLQAAIQCNKAVHLMVSFQPAELVQDCVLAGQKHMVAFPGLLTHLDCR